MSAAAATVLWISACGGAAAGGDAAIPTDTSPAPDTGVEEDASASPADAGADGADPDAGRTDSFGLLTLNLHCLQTAGTPYAGDAARLGAVAELVRAEDVSVVLLQEVCDDGTTSALVVLEGLLGPDWSSTYAFAHTAWEGTPDEAAEGVAIVARGELIDPATHAHRVQGALRRVAVTATLPAALSGLRVASVHLDHQDDAVRVGQAREAAVVALSEAYPGLGALVAGDLNARAGSPPHAAFLAAGFEDASAALPADRIDHVLVHRGAPVVALESRLVFDTPETAVSDHPGVLVRLAPRTPPTLATTRIVARAAPGADHWLALRGDAPPLDWERGWPMHERAPGEWRYVSSEHGGGGTFELKVLVDDATWQTGPNETARAGEETVVTPAF